MLAIQLCMLVFSLCYWPESIRDRGIAECVIRLCIAAPSWPNHRRSAQTCPPKRRVVSSDILRSRYRSPSAPAAPPRPPLRYGILRGNSAINDPLEPLNRTVFEFNERWTLCSSGRSPTIIGCCCRRRCKTGAQLPGKSALPVILVNDLLQGEWERAGTTTRRFIVNTTVGVGGLGDPASDFGFPAHNGDFGQTLAVWGCRKGRLMCRSSVRPIRGMLPAWRSTASSSTRSAC